MPNHNQKKINKKCMLHTTFINKCTNDLPCTLSHTADIIINLFSLLTLDLIRPSFKLDVFYKQPCVYIYIYIC